MSVTPAVANRDWLQISGPRSLEPNSIQLLSTDQLTSSGIYDLLSASPPGWSHQKSKNGELDHILSGCATALEKSVQNGGQIVHHFEPPNGNKEAAIYIALKNSRFIRDTVEECCRVWGLHKPQVLAHEFERPVAATSDFQVESTTDRFAVCYIEFRCDDIEKVQNVENDLVHALQSLQLATSDHVKMKEATQTLTRTLLQDSSHAGPDKVTNRQAGALLEWLRKSNFVYLGIAERRLDAKHQVEDPPSATLGIFRGDSSLIQNYSLECFKDASILASSDNVFGVSRLPYESPVLRRSRMMHFAVRSTATDGQEIVTSFLGLIPRRGQRAYGDGVPIISDKLLLLTNDQNISRTDHDRRFIVELMDSLPKDVALRLTLEELKKIVQTTLPTHSIDETRVVLVPDRRRNEMLAVIVTLRDLDDAASLRIKAYFEEKFGAPSDSSELNEHYWEPFRRLFIQVPLLPDSPHVKQEELEGEVGYLLMTWEEKLAMTIRMANRFDNIDSLIEGYKDAFPAKYQAAHPFPTEALDDLSLIEKSCSTNTIKVDLRQDKNGELIIAVASKDRAIPVSEATPILESAGFRVISEEAYEVAPSHNGKMSLHHYKVIPHEEALKRDFKTATTITEGLEEIFQDKGQIDELNSLIVTTGLTIRSVSTLRAYVNFFAQTGAVASKTSVIQSLANNPLCAESLWALFDAKFNPNIRNPSTSIAFTAERRKDLVNQYRQEFMDELQKVASTEQDFALRSLLKLIDQTDRTTYFKNTDIIAYKINLSDFDVIGVPRPKVLTMITSPKVEAMHLRMDKVSRGGLRFSERKHDYFAEVLALVRAQDPKNCFIVPRGAKGAFIGRTKEIEQLEQVVRMKPDAVLPLFLQALSGNKEVNASFQMGPIHAAIRDHIETLTLEERTHARTDSNKAREHVRILLSKARSGFEREVENSYRDFISGLLSITDNLKDGKITPPQDLVIYDMPDPYLVVAADKGTASLSNVANEIALVQGFWLGDAFASGGKNGYDHKKLAITSLGALQSWERHFRDLGRSHKEAFSLVAIGDMSGDVAGNGLRLLENARLLGAFDHRHIFVDPNPQDIQSSLKERVRLFHKPRSSWKDYDANLISGGGGIFDRNSKAIPLTPQMREAFAIPTSAPETVSGEELIQFILKAQVDCIFNGGIGTYIKSKTESHTEVRDSSNDKCRVNAEEVRALCIVEGGNLGLTQKARLAYALKGGRVNTDGIDNSGGVGLSDREVNFKLLLAQLVETGVLSQEQRNKMIEDAGSAAVRFVIAHNRRHNILLSVAEEASKRNVDYYRLMIHQLDRAGYIDRGALLLPDDEELDKRAAQGQGLHRSELAVCMAAAKMWVREKVLKSGLPQSEGRLLSFLYDYFPGEWQEKFPEAIESHPLRNEIIATQVANYLVDYLGVEFFHRARRELHKDIDVILKSALASEYILDGRKYRHMALNLEDVLKSSRALGFVNELAEAQRELAVWLSGVHENKHIEFLVSRYEKAFDVAIASPASVLSAAQLEDYERRVHNYLGAAAPPDLAQRLSAYHELAPILEKLAIRTGSAGIDIDRVNKVYEIVATAVGFSEILKLEKDVTAASSWDRELISASLRRVRYQLSKLVGHYLNRGDMNETEIAQSIAKIKGFAALQEMLGDIKSSREKNASNIALWAHHFAQTVGVMVTHPPRKAAAAPAVVVQAEAHT